MRRVICFILLGLGVFAIALATMLRFYAYPVLAKVPLDQRTSVVATGNGITSLVIRRGADGVPVPQIRHNLDVTATTQVTGDLSQPEVRAGGDVAVWIETQAAVDGDGNLLNAFEREVCIDRHTSMAVRPCETQYIKTGEERESGVRDQIQQPGLNFKFPFQTKQQNYQMYDLNVRKPVEARFAGQDRISGIDVYRFVMDVPFTKIGEETVPGSLIGSPQPSVRTDLYYQGVRTMWVQPDTGMVVHVQQEQRKELRDPSRGSRTVVLNGKFSLDEASLSANVAAVNDAVSRLSLLTTGQVWLWVIGGALLVAGVVLMVIRPRGRPASHGPEWPDEDSDGDSAVAGFNRSRAVSGAP